MRHFSTIGIILATAIGASAVIAQTAPKVFTVPNKGQIKVLFFGVDTVTDGPSARPGRRAGSRG